MSIKSALNNSKTHLGPNKLKHIQRKVRVIQSLQPDCKYTGLGGFTSYCIFEFTEKQIYVLESLIYGNATYILGEDWESLSQLSKAEILNGNHHLKRFVHGENWENNLREFIKNYKYE